MRISSSKTTGSETFFSKPISSDKSLGIYSSNAESSFNNDDESMEPDEDDGPESKSCSDNDAKLMEPDANKQPKPLNINKRKNQQSQKRKYKKCNKENSFIVIGQNSASVSSKLESLDLAINRLNPSVILLQESRLKKEGTLNCWLPNI